ncbi:hypothetical protein LSAT2_026336, partial [Lamellibrachia satsuma]
MSSSDQLQWINAFIEETTAINVHKPPSMPFIHLPQYSHPAIYAASTANFNDWVSNLYLTLLYDNHQSNSFRSGRWQRKRTRPRLYHFKCHTHELCISDCTRTISTFSTPPIFNQTRRSRPTNTVLLTTTLDHRKKTAV